MAVREPTTSDFDAQMQQLAAEVEKRSAHQAAAGNQMPKSEKLAVFRDLLVPMAKRLETIQKAVEGIACSESQADADTLENRLENLAAQLEKKTALESANEKLFDRLHEELKSYKDAFLFEALQRPVIQEVIMLFDVLQQLTQQARAEADGAKSQRSSRKKGTVAEPMRVMAENLENVMHLVGETFERLGVRRLEAPEDCKDKAAYRILRVDEADSEEDDGRISEVTRIGFVWRNSVLRPADVVVKRWGTGSQEEKTTEATEGESGEDSVDAETEE